MANTGRRQGVDTSVRPAPPRSMTLPAQLAKHLMTHNPLSIRENAAVHEAAGIMVDEGYTALPVINSAGRGIGVVSQTDVVRHERERAIYLRGSREQEPQPGYHLEAVDATPVSEIMTPLVFSVLPEAPIEQVVADMLERKIHRVFVVDESGVLVGVISAIDILRGLQTL